MNKTCAMLWTDHLAESFTVNTATWLFCKGCWKMLLELQVKDFDRKKNHMISESLVPVNSGWFLLESGWYRVSDQFPARIVRSQKLS